HNVVSGNTADNYLFGGGDSDWLQGYEGNDTLDGGAGQDTLNGHLGNDTFIVDYTDGATTLPGIGGGRGLVYAAVSDICSFGAGPTGGIDTVEVQGALGISLALTNLSSGAFQNIENVTLLGTANIDCTGNTLANVLTGNDGDNVMAGGDPSSGTPSNDAL